MRSVLRRSARRAVELVGLAIALVVAACADPVPRFDVRVQFETQRGCTGGCDAYGLGCGGLVGIRIVDAEAPSEVYAQTCIEVDRADSLCSLRDIDVARLRDIPATTVQIQAAVWKPDATRFGDPMACPTDTMFDLQGVPVLTNPELALGGAVYFQPGSAPVARVALSCVNANALDSPECLANTIRVDAARVHDVETTLSVPPNQARALDVFIAKPSERVVSPGVFEWIIETQNSFELSLDEAAGVPQWNGAFIADFDDTACILAIDKSATMPTTSAHCVDVSPGITELPGMRGWLVSEADLDVFLAALALNAVPSTGFVVGRVVDDLGYPVADVSVSPRDLGVWSSVSYLSEDRTTTLNTLTTSNGYFFSTNAEPNTAWEAQSVDGRQEDGTYRAGLIAGKVSTVQIRLLGL